MPAPEMKRNQRDCMAVTRTPRMRGPNASGHPEGAVVSEPLVNGLLHHPWCWLVSQCEIARTRKWMARHLSPIERALDRSCYGHLRISGHMLHAVAGPGSSDEAMLWLRGRILPGVLSDPDRWLFLVQAGAGCSRTGDADQYSVARHVAHRLRIPLVRDPFLPMSDERVIAAAARRGLPSGATEDDLYASLCYDYLPRPHAGDIPDKGLRIGEIHGVVHVRWEARRIQREMRWSLAWPHLLRIVSRLLDRVGHDRPGALDDYYDRRLRRGLRAAALGLNRERLRLLLARHPMRTQVLLLLDEADLPVILPRLAIAVRSSMATLPETRS